jgi:hypothetical protein
VYGQSFDPKGKEFMSSTSSKDSPKYFGSGKGCESSSSSCRAHIYSGTSKIGKEFENERTDSRSWKYYQLG